jgi:hypothetical protein
MLNLRRYQIIIFTLFLIVYANRKVYSQEINPLYDLQKFRFGYALMGNTAKMKYTTSDEYLLQDTVRGLNSIFFPGFGIGGVVSMRLLEHWDIRAMMNVTFTQRNMRYDFKQGETRELEMESTYLELPVMFKYKSKRHNNIRLYCVGGITYRHDFVSEIEKDRSETNPVLALYPNTFSYDIGVGIDLYFEYFRFSPEVKICNGIGNQMVRDTYIYTTNLQRISPKLVVFSLIFQ